jgi:hypothetical protein
MKKRFEEILTHDNTEECVACRSRDFVNDVIIPAVGAWEATTDLPRFALALHGAAGLLGAILAEGVPREEIDDALATLLDEIGTQVAEEGALSGPAQGNA